MTSYERNANVSAIRALPLTKLGSVLLWAGAFGLAFVLLVAVLMTIGAPVLPEGAFPP
jgi:hypothetical protein